MLEMSFDEAVPEFRLRISGPTICHDRDRNRQSNVQKSCGRMLVQQDTPLEHDF